jgi:trehalose/maltose hydrolase-like predicted phosphorylase
VAEILKKQGYNTVYSRHRNVWKHLWDRFDIGIEGDAYAQVTMRFNIYHSVIAAPLHTDHLPIGARGLSCQAYQGAAFWDQEIFNMPMFLYAAPNIARNILTYRYLTIGGARNKAEKLGYRGAFYAWVSGDSVKKSARRISLSTCSRAAVSGIISMTGRSTFHRISAMPSIDMSKSAVIQIFCSKEGGNHPGCRPIRCVALPFEAGYRGI